MGWLDAAQGLLSGPPRRRLCWTLLAAGDHPGWARVRQGGFSDEQPAHTLTWIFVERVTRIELALSAWEADRLRPAAGLTCRFWWPVLAVVDPSSPWLMAR